MVDSPVEMPIAEALVRGLLPPVLAILATLWIALRSASKELDPESFRRGPMAPVRRALGWAAIAASLYLGAFAVLGVVGQPMEWVEPGSPVVLFGLHLLFVLALTIWWAAGEPRTAAGGDRSLSEELGLESEEPVQELVLGTCVGVAIWAVVLGCVMVFGLLLSGVGLRGALPEGMPPMVAWIVGQPWWLRLAVSLSAGIVEEVFFRGFLQPRIGLVGSTVLFACAHLGYGEPFMLFGVTLLSLSYGLLARWRGSVFAAVAAHATFDAVQLLVLIPTAAAAASAGG